MRWPPPQALLLPLLPMRRPATPAPLPVLLLSLLLLPLLLQPLLLLQPIRMRPMRMRPPPLLLSCRW